LKPEDSHPSTEVSGRKSGFACARKRSEALHCENDQTRSFRILTTGMFYLIVKDPERLTA